MERAQAPRLVGRASSGRWVGDDVPDFAVDRAPHSRPDPDVGGPDALAGDDPFVMQADGKGWLFAPKGMVDGPLPTHYEPQESPVANPLYPQQQSPARMVFPRKDNLSAPSAGDPGVDVYPYVFTTYRLTEHHTAGGMSRWLPYLSELQPEMFCEVSPELAAERGLEPYGWATIISPARGDRGPGARHGADDATGDRRAHRAPDRAALPLGRRRRRGGQRRRRQRPARGDPGPERADPGVARSASCDIIPGPPAAGRGPAAAGRGVPELDAGATTETGNTLLTDRTKEG